VTGHFGYWEMQAIAHPFHSPTIAVMARPLDNPRLHALLERLRTMTGNRVLYRQGVLRRVLRELTSNNGVAILIDQHLHTPEAVYVDYFGRPAATTSALAALALRTGAVVIPVFALPLPGGRYRFVYEHPVEPPAPMPRTRCWSSRSAAPTCSRCTCAGIPSCGCGCTAAGASANLASRMTWKARPVSPKRSEGGPSATTRSMADPSRIVVLAPNWLGDAVMALPALADLRRRFPAAHLAVAARASVAPMFELAHGLDAGLTLRWKGRVLDRAGLRADTAALRDAGFDAAVLLPNSMASAWLVRGAGVPERWGYAADWRSPLLTRAVPKPRGSRHQAQYYQHLTQALGAPAGPLEPMLTAAADDVAPDGRC
jgi:hypothetical protein